MRHAIKMLMIPEELYRTLMLATTAKEAAVAHERGMPQNPASALDSTHAQMERELRQQQQQLVPQKRSKRKRKEALNAGDVIAGDDGGGGGADGQQIRFTGAYKRYRKLLQDERDRPQPVQIQNLPDLEESVSSALRRKTPAEEAAAATIVKVKKQTTRKKKRVASNSSVRDEEGEEEEDEVFDSASEEHSSEKTPQKPPANDYYATPEHVQQRRADVLEYVSRNAQQLGLTNQLQPLRSLRGELVPIKTSSLEKILDYHWDSPTHRAGRNPPSGYTAFMQTARVDKFLASRLFTPSREPETGKKHHSRTNSSRTQSGKGGLAESGLHKKPTCISSSFVSFKPTLW